MKSIRNRTLLLVLGVLSLSLSLISYRSYRDAQHEVEELFDARLAQSARLLAGLIDADLPDSRRALLQDALDAALVQARGPLGHEYENKLAFAVYDSDGAPLLGSASAPPGRLETLLGSNGDGDLQGGFLSRERDGQRWRLFLLRDAPDALWILVSERADVRGELAQKIARRSLQPDLIGLPLLGLLVWLAVGWGLRPLAQMARSLRQRAPDSLAELPRQPLPDELLPIRDALDRLLAQVTELLGREKRFLADAAHELRTPLAVLRIHAQNALAATEPAERDAALQQISAAVERAGRVVGQLLTLARLEPGASETPPSSIDLLPLVRQELAELAPLALERDQELTLEAAEADDYRLLGDGPALSILLQNLIANAIQYTPLSGRIQVSLEADVSHLQLAVSDSGPGVPAAQRERLFQRFFRQGDSSGAGLGLAIAARIAELHGSRVELLDSPLGGLQVRLSLPRRPA
ncbi:ATP-binding protein [Pseudomonas mangrovi]|uniref:histidine kinase n=1 Tax=Pseudomonas mangrovi TaxID=2161748 RepID=A0A2T5PEN2_9PSED|nr:ATP-binding protein [Pseudomonas mangrovi]PTU76189.1 two-component sensor histidine kinase [Pseudomonas mangrovi]